MLIRICNDNLFISERLKEIDAAYYVVYNTKQKIYEVHRKGQADNTFCVGLPFSELDERTVNFVLKTRVENVDRLIEEIEKNNLKIEKNNQKILEEKIKEVLYDC